MNIRWFKQHNIVPRDCAFTKRQRAWEIQTELVLQFFDGKEWVDVPVEENYDGMKKAEQEIIERGECE